MENTITSNPIILQPDALVPCVREGNEDFFMKVDGKVYSREVEIAGVRITTAPLLFGKKLDILGISQHDKLLELGVQDTTDVVDPPTSLAAVYLYKEGAAPLKLELTHLHQGVFYYPIDDADGINHVRLMRDVVFHGSNGEITVKDLSLHIWASVRTDIGDVLLEYQLNEEEYVATGLAGYKPVAYDLLMARRNYNRRAMVA